MNEKIGIVVSKFNEEITSRLAKGAKNALLQKGLKPENIIEVEVPGSFELPLAAKFLIEDQKVQGVVALGVVIKGDTDHYEYICSATSAGLMDLQLFHSIPIGFGVLTCHTEEQAMARAGGSEGNKGADAAETVLQMMGLKVRLSGEQGK